MAYSIEWIHETTAGLREATKSVERSSYLRYYQVKTSSKDVDEETVVNARGIPNIGSAHPKNSQAKCFSVHAKQQEHSRVHWIVKVEYTVGDWPEENESLDSIPAKVRVRADEITKVMKKAYQVGDPFGSPSKEVLNSAGRPFSKPPEIPNSVIRIMVEDYIPAADMNIQSLMAYKNVVNAVAITVGGIDIGAYEGKIKEIETEPVKDKDGGRFFQRRFTILVNRETFRISIRDQGYEYYTAPLNLETMESDGQLIKADSEDGETPDHPFDLDGQGVLLEKDADAVYLTFAGYWEWTWDTATLNFPEEEYPTNEE